MEYWLIRRDDRAVDEQGFGWVGGEGLTTEEELREKGSKTGNGRWRRFWRSIECPGVKLGML